VIDPSVGAIALASPLPDFLESHLIIATPPPGALTGVLITPDMDHFQQFRFARLIPTAGVLTLNGIELAGFGTSPPEFGASPDGGAIDCWGSLQLYNCSIHDCLSTGNGGAVAVDKLLTVDHSAFFTNVSAGAGGAIYSSSTSVVAWSISNSGFTMNLSLGGNGMYNGGGAIFLQTANTSSFICTQTNFSENHAEGNGGAICMISWMLTVTSTILPGMGVPPGFIGNDAGGYGGAIYTHQSTSVYVDVAFWGGNFMFLPLIPTGGPTANNVYVHHPIPPGNVFLGPGTAPFVVVPIGS
jgi:predicted outer membrane repeat protein